MALAETEGKLECHNCLNWDINAANKNKSKDYERCLKRHKIIDGDPTVCTDWSPEPRTCGNCEVFCIHYSDGGDGIKPPDTTPQSGPSGCWAHSTRREQLYFRNLITNTDLRYLYNRPYRTPEEIQ